MDLPVTDPVVADEVADDAEDVTADTWLIDADDPLMTDDKLARVADDQRPDRLAWNTFRTLGLWETDMWVPAFLEMACGDDNRLSALEWGGTQVVPWRLDVPGSEVSTVALDGPQAYVIVACSAVKDPPQEQLRAAAIAALDGSLAGARDVGMVVVVPPVADVEDVDARLRVATDIELHEGRTAAGLLGGAMGTVTWSDLGRLALDLIEQGDPDTSPTEQVHRLVTELQQQYPGVEV